jgi:dUTPase
MNLLINNNHDSSLSDGIILRPAHNGDAGYDLLAASEPKIVGDLWRKDFYKNISYIEYETNLSIEPSKNDKEYEFFSLLFPRSSISNYNLQLCNSVGVIDSGYRDSIKVRFNYLIQPENYFFLEDDKKNKFMLGCVDTSKIYKKGDKIAQLVFSNHLHPCITTSSKLNECDRNLGGFGSTGI